MSDLANFSNYYTYSTPLTDPHALYYTHGQGSVFARIMSHIDLAKMDMEQLRQAAIEERKVDNRLQN